MRLSELIGLKNSSIDLYASTLKALGKRNKERLIPFGPHLKKLIEEYKKLRKKRKITHTEDYFFVTDNGKSCIKIRLPESKTVLVPYTQYRKTKPSRIAPTPLLHTC